MAGREFEDKYPTSGQDAGLAREKDI